MSQVGLLMLFEAGEATDEQTLTLFSELVRSGLADGQRSWGVPGSDKGGQC